MARFPWKKCFTIQVNEIRDYISSLPKGADVKGFVRSIDTNGFIWICKLRRVFTIHSLVVSTVQAKRW